MRYLVGFVCVLALVIACGTDSPDLSAGVSGEVSAEWCYTYCVDLECNFDHTPAGCQEQCKRELAEPRGGYFARVEQCQNECHWESLCQPETDAWRTCQRELSETCADCPEGTVLGDCIAESSVFLCNRGACISTYGDCNAGPYDGICLREVTAGLCDVGYETCIAQEGDCASRAR